MCGFLGIAGSEGRALVERLLGDLTHRGPDDEGAWSSPELALGHRRLTIIGLDREGRQPMVSRSGESVLVFNGEIYHGMFALAWYRPCRQSVLLARDRWGKKPLFWGTFPSADGGSLLVFSSELRAGQ